MYQVKYKKRFTFGLIALAQGRGAASGNSLLAGGEQMLFGASQGEAQSSLFF